MSQCGEHEGRMGGGDRFEKAIDGAPDGLLVAEGRHSGQPLEATTQTGATLGGGGGRWVAV